MTLAVEKRLRASGNCPAARMEDLPPEQDFDEEVGGVVVLHGAVELEDEGAVELGRDLLLADDVRLEAAVYNAPLGEALEGVRLWQR